MNGCPLVGSSSAVRKQAPLRLVPSFWYCRQEVRKLGLATLVVDNLCTDTRIPPFAAC